MGREVEGVAGGQPDGQKQQVEGKAAESVNPANMAPDFSGQMVDTSDKSYTFDPEHFPLLLKLAREIGKDIFCFDLETSELLEARTFGITELGTLRVKQEGRIEVRSRYINPGYPIGKIASEITGITDAMVAGKAHYSERYAQAMGRSARRCLVIGYNIRSFDIPGIFKTHDRYGFEHPQFIDVLDVRDVWMKLTGKKKGKLSDVVQGYGIEVMDAHRASGDVAMTALLLNHMLWRHGVDAVLGCRVMDDRSMLSGEIPQDGRTHAPKALSDTFVLRNRLVVYFNNGNPYEGVPALTKALQLTSEEAREADYELSGLIRDKKVPVDIFKNATAQEFILLHLGAACEEEGVTKEDPSLKLKPVLEFIKKKKGCPKRIDYIQLRAALASLPVPTT